MNFLDVLQLLESYSWGTIILGLFIFFALNPEKLDYWKALFFRIFASFSRSSERKTISCEIQSSIHHFVLKYKAEKIMPAYSEALNKERSSLIVEFGDLHYR